MVKRSKQTLSELQPISQDQTREILAGPREIPSAIKAQIGERLENSLPLVDMDSFDALIAEEMQRPYEADREAIFTATERQIITLGSTSILMAWMLAGDIRIPRPRRLHEHNQSVANVMEDTFGSHLDERDKVLRPVGMIFQDGGKSYGVAIDGHSRNQGMYNLQVMQNILPYSSALDESQKKAISLLATTDILGPTIRAYHDKNMPFDEAIARAEEKLIKLYREFPEEYADRLEAYIDIVYRSDAGAHTQHPAARHVNMETGALQPDVTDENRAFRSEKGKPMTLDHLFSEAPDDHGKLRFYREKDLKVVRRLLPKVYPGEEA